MTIIQDISIIPPQHTDAVSAVLDAINLQTITITASSLQCFLLNAPTLQTFTTTTDSLSYAYFNSPADFGFGATYPIGGNIRIFAPNSNKISVTGKATSITYDTSYT